MIKLDGYELIIGSSIDPQFGPVLLFGTGGSLVEVFKDRSLALPPLTTTLARRMIEQTKIYEALKGVRGRESVDLEALQKLMVRFSQLVVEQRWIKEIDINPLLASPKQLLSLDARVVLHPSDMTEAELPELAIRPYPIQYIDQWTSQTNDAYLIRPIRPEDEPLMIKFHETLSERTVQLRYFTPMSLRQRTAHERLSKIVFIDYDREMVLVAEHENSRGGDKEIAAVGRLTKSYGFNDAEFGIIVSDKFQGQGLGSEILQRLIDIGRTENISRIVGHILVENKAMLNLAEGIGFKLIQEVDVVRAEIEL